MQFTHWDRGVGSCCCVGGGGCFGEELIRVQVTHYEDIGAKICTKDLPVVETTILLTGVFVSGEEYLVELNGKESLTFAAQ